MYRIPALALAAFLGLVLHVPTPHALGAAASAVLGGILLALLGLCCFRLEGATDPRPPGFLVPFTALLFAAVCAVRQLQAIFHLPIDPEYADMLPLIRSALESFWAGVSPYHVYSFPWPLPLTFLPGLWLSFLPAWLAGIDLRLLGLLGSLVLLALLVRLAARPSGIAAWAVLLLLATSSKFGEFARIGHLPLYWLLLLLFAEDWLRSRKRAFIWLGLLLGTRQTAWLLLPPVALQLWLRAGPDRRPFRSLAPLGASLGIAALLIVPFLLWDPAAFVAGTLLWYPRLGDLVYSSDPVTVVGQPGFGGLMHELGAVSLLRWLALGAILVCWRRGGRSATAALAAGALATAAFALFSAPCWWYSLMDPVLLLCPALVAVQAPAAVVWKRLAWVVPGAAVAAWLGTARPHVEALHFDSDSVPRMLRRFHLPERWGQRTMAWASSPQARLALPRLEPFSGEMLLLLRPSPDLASPLDIELNGALLFRLVPAADWAEYRIPVPASRFVLGNNSLVLRAEAPPRSESDRRPLTVALDELALQSGN